MSGPSLSLVVPSHGRPAALRRCLAAAAAQLDPGDQLVVVARAGDHATAAVAAGAGATVTEVAAPGYAPALHAGLAAASRELVAFLDDDAVPGAGWAPRLKRHFAATPSLGAVGGRIANFDGVRTSNSFFSRGPVARIGLAGRLTSRLHEVPADRRVEPVDFLAGSNMCYRRELVAIPLALDCGMAPSLEIELALQVRAAGRRVLYDSDLVVEHYPAPRPDHARGDRVRAAYEAGYTYAAILRRHFAPPRRLLALGWWVLVGTRECPGLALWPYLRASGRPARARAAAAYRGRRDACLGRPPRGAREAGDAP